MPWSGEPPYHHGLEHFSCNGRQYLVIVLHAVLLEDPRQLGLIRAEENSQCDVYCL